MTAVLTTRTAKTNDSTPVLFQAAFADLLGDGTKLAVAHALFNTLGALIDPASKQDIAAVLSALAGTLAISAAALPLPAGAATDAKLEAVRALLAAPLTITPQRAESLWTDDSGSYFVRVDLGGTISWADLSGNTASAPGTGSRPAAGATVLLSRSSFQATAAATGYGTGDYLDHFVTTDPASGAVLGNFWLNLTTGAKLVSAPASGNISPVAPLPTGAATAAGVAAVVAALGVPLSIANVSSVTYNTVAASVAAQVLGNTGAAGDYLGELLVVPASTSPGPISIQDGSGTTITVFAGGSNSISNLVPFGIPLGVKSKSGAWKVTTGAGLSVVATGNFT